MLEPTHVGCYGKDWWRPWESQSDCARGKECVEAPPQLNPFAKAQREGNAEKQTEMI